MHKSIVLSIAFAVCAACGSQGVDGQPGPDVGGGSDAGGGSDTDGGPDERVDASADAAADADGPPPRGFQIRKDIVVPDFPSGSICYHFTIPNTETLAIRKWKSEMSSAIQSMALYIGGTQEEGTVSVNCPDYGKSDSVWVYSAHQAKSELAFPSDDGTGKPLGFELPAGKKAFLRMRFVNTSAEPVTANVTLSAGALPEDAAFTKTDTYVTYNSAISIPAQSTNHVESATCETLSDTKFWAMSMQGHKQAVKMLVKSGESTSTAVAYEATDWQNPPKKTWPADPFFAFDQNKLTFECTYDNPTGRTITSGSSFSSDEECATMGYYFPATKPVLCYCVNIGCVNFEP